ncbi:hypothetical protein [Vibrio crassostreae]|uniref:hypothetical protein n=1 Tax=Vibrio crassostreae TaxID=246167 RepID=UPI001B3069E6|nr:hypothetical protein [Vibrio crassostreae]
MKKINLSSFKSNKPESAKYFDQLEDSLSAMVDGAMGEPYPSLPHPKRLIEEKVSLPPFVTSEFFKPYYTKEAGSLLNLQHSLFTGAIFDLDLYSNLLVHQFPAISNLYNQMGVDPHNAVLAGTIEQYHQYNDAPIVEYTEGLIGLLSQTSSTGLDKMPVRYIRSPYNCMYLDFRNAPQLPMMEDEEVVGAYVIERTTQPQEISDRHLEYIKNEPSMARLLESGLLDLNKEMVYLTILLVSHPSDMKHLSDGYRRTTFSYMFNADTDDDVTIGDIIKGHTGGMVSDTDYSFAQMMSPLSLVFNSILYMNSNENERAEIKRGTDLEVKLKQVKNPKKARKLLRQARGNYDSIRIGKLYKLDGVMSRTGDGWKVEPHIRRGHFRNQRYGKGRALSKLKWIMPMPIGEEKAATKTVKMQ